MNYFPRVDTFFKTIDPLKLLPPLIKFIADNRVISIAIAALGLLGSAVMSQMVRPNIVGSKILSGSLLIIASIVSHLFNHLKSDWFEKTGNPQGRAAETSNVIPRRDELSRTLQSLSSDTCDGCVAGVYITTNEVNADVIPILKSTSSVDNSCHVGFSGWHNFDIMALRKSSRGVICDFNRFNKIFIDKTLSVLTTVSTRHEFVVEIIPFIEKNEPKFSPNIMSSRLDMPGYEEVCGELKREASWLSSDESFSHIRNLALKGRIVAITEDIQNTETFEKISRVFKEKAISVDTLYLSNIEGYVEKSRYNKTVRSLINPETLVIDVRKVMGEDLCQTVHKGVDFFNE